MPGPSAADGGELPRPASSRGLPDPSRRSVRILVLLGPSATGKTELALRVAELLGGEIVGCDALQVYTGFDIATAKPSQAARDRVPHHLVDEVDPEQDFSAAEYVRRAENAIAGIVARGHLPLVVGGTGMYLRALLRGLVPAPARDSELRRRLRALSARFGPARLHRWLAQLDAHSAARIARGDSQRIVRALELALQGPGNWSEVLARHGAWRDPAERHESLKIGLDLPREALVARLEARVDQFYEAGLVDEVRGLLARGLPAEANAWKAIGYREVRAAILRGEDPESTRAEVKRNSRRYAKRQRTWFRSEPGVNWLDALEPPEQLSQRIVDLWRGGMQR